tara:strand:- start:269 stop:484 length:216 start_codon:yes stop_codon:yes gene_type:complete
MENQEILKAIANLADKVSKYHERLLAVEREKDKIEKALDEHFKNCSCHPVIKGKPYKADLDSEVECEACGA